MAVTGERARGSASRWTDRGFGFITPEDGGEDLFCHFSDIADGNALEEGKEVEFVKIYDERKGKERETRYPKPTLMNHQHRRDE